MEDNSSCEYNTDTGELICAEECDRITDSDNNHICCLFCGKFPCKGWDEPLGAIMIKNNAMKKIGYCIEEKQQ